MTIQTKSGASADHGWPSMHASGLGSPSEDCINLMTSVSKLQMAWCILVYLLGFSRVSLSLAKPVGHAVDPFPLKLMTPPPTRRQTTIGGANPLHHLLQVTWQWVWHVFVSILCLDYLAYL